MHLCTIGRIQNCVVHLANLSLISTQRLKPIREMTKNAMVNILDNGSICLEFFKRRNNTDHITEIFWISPDGQCIQVYQHTVVLPMPLGNKPPTIDTEQYAAILSLYPATKILEKI